MAAAAAGCARSWVVVAVTTGRTGTLLSVTVDQVEAVDLELVPGFLWYALHVPFQ